MLDGYLAEQRQSVPALDRLLLLGRQLDDYLHRLSQLDGMLLLTGERRRIQQLRQEIDRLLLFGRQLDAQLKSTAYDRVGTSI